MLVLKNTPAKVSRTSFTVLVFVSSIFLILFCILAWGISHTGSFNSYLFSFDIYIEHMATSFVSVPYAQALLFITNLADPTIVSACIVTLALVLAFFHEEIILAFVVISLAVGEGVAVYIKALFARSRPSELLYTIDRIGYSFPSGHAVASMVFYGSIAYCLCLIFHKRWQKNFIIILASIVIFLIGYSRVALGVHWPTDVIGGWLLGAVFLTLFIILSHIIHKRVLSSLHIPHGISIIFIMLVFIVLSFFITYFYLIHAGGILIQRQ